MEYDKRLDELLKLCQNAWVTVQEREKEIQQQQQPSVHCASEELHKGIKRLVQLQDALDEDAAMTRDPKWRHDAESTMEHVRKQLELALQVANGNKPAQDPSAATPVLTTSISSSSSTLSSASLRLPEAHNNALRHKKRSSCASSLSSIMNTSIPEEEEEGAVTTFDRSRSPLDMLNNNHTDLLSPRRVMPTKSVSTNTHSLDPSISPQRQQSRADESTRERPFGRRSVAMDDWSLPEAQQHAEENKAPKLRMIPLFKGLKPTRSTPLPSNAPAQINFYKDDDTSVAGQVFACDAIVDQPLRIGVGYGSYICYNCTVLSNKGPPISVRKRYSDFVDLRDELVKRYPRLKNSIPKLPPKKVVGKFTPSFIEQRRRDLEYFFKYVVLHPTLGTSPTVTHWIAP